MKELNKKEWTRISFGEVCKNLNQAEPHPLSKGINRYIGLEHIEGENLHIKSWGNVAEGTTFTKKFTKGNVLFGKRRSYLKKAAIADFDGICSGDILVLEANEKIIHKDLFPFLVSSERFFAHAVQTSAGSLSPRTKFQDLAKFEFLLPPKEQQAKLAELLWAGDKVVEGYYDLKNILASKKDLTEKHKIKKYTKKYKLKEICDIIGGYAFKSELFSSNSFEKRQVLKIANLTTEGIDLNKVPAFIEDKQFDRKFLFSKGDIAISLTGSQGKRDYGFAVINENGDDLWVNQRLAIIRVNESRAISKYIYSLMKQDIFLDTFFMNATGTANQANVSTKEMANIELPIPSISEQKEYVTMINSFENNVIALSDLIKNAKQIQKQLINQIFGE